MMMVVARPFETSENTCPATKRPIPGGRNLSFLIEIALMFKNTKFQDAASFSEFATLSW